MVRWVGRGTQQEELMSIAASGKQEILNNISNHWMMGSRIIEIWNNCDALSLIEQTGRLPTVPFKRGNLVRLKP